MSSNKGSQMMDKEKFFVEYYDDEDLSPYENPSWVRTAIQMCSESDGLLCDECKANPDHIQDCSYFHCHTFNKEIAKLILNQLKQDGRKARIVNA